MIESILKKTVNKFPDIIERIERLETVEEELIEQLKAKVRLFDGTILYVREVWISEKIESYSYYWLRKDETLIIGWDNATHHRGISSFPHHKHLDEKIQNSDERTLEDVLHFIKTFLG